MLQLGPQEVPVECNLKRAQRWLQIMQWVSIILILHNLSVILQVVRRLIDVKLLGYLVLENNDGLRFGVVREQALDAVEPLNVLLLDVPRVRVVPAAVHAALNNQKVL